MAAEMHVRQVWEVSRERCNNNNATLYLEYKID